MMQGSMNIKIFLEFDIRRFSKIDLENIIRVLFNPYRNNG